MSTLISARVQGSLEDDYLDFKRNRNLSPTDATKMLLARGLAAYESNNNKEIHRLTIQNLMISKRLLALMSEDELKEALEDASAVWEDMESYDEQN